MTKYIVGFVFIISLCYIIIGNSSDDSNDIDESTIDDTIEDNEVSVPSFEVQAQENKMIDSILTIKVPKSLNSVAEQILYRIAYVTSYNSSTRNPNWVAWELTREHTDGPYHRNGIPYYAEDGSVLGIGNITVDTYRNGYFVDLEVEGPRQEHSDWRAHPSNIEHGHMCPAADNKWDKAAMNQSFLLTNMCPQNGNLNGGGWKKLEEKCRSWAIRYGKIYIIAGPIFNLPIEHTMGEGQIAIPDAFFKVIICLEGNPKALGFIYRNDDSRQSLNECVCSVDDVEQQTGFDFFDSLPDDIEDAVESASNLRIW